MRKLITILIILICTIFSLKGQNFNLTNERTFELLYINKLDTAANFHSAIKPFNRAETEVIFNYDSTMAKLKIGNEGSFINELTSQHLVGINKKFKLFINPIINGIATTESNNNFSKTVIEKSGGLSLKTAYSKKWSAEWDFLYDNSEYVSHVDALVQQHNISPG